MMALISAQTANRSVWVTRQGWWKALSSFVRDSIDFVTDNPVVLVIPVALVVVVVLVTRPRVS